MERRIVLKVSGAALQGDRPFGIDPAELDRIAGQVAECSAAGVQIAVVIGGGNLFRGREAEASGMTAATAHTVGMLSTVLNGLALQDAVEARGADVRTMSAFQMPQIAEPYIRRRAIRHLDKGRVVICVGGTGNPFVTTDTATALRAIEIEASALLMGKHGIDGVYTSDPNREPDARRYETLNFQDAIAARLGVVMDSAAISLCAEHGLPIHVFSIQSDGAIVDAVLRDRIGTRIHAGPTALAS